MADPVKKPLTWSKAYPVYAEKHDMYRVFQELLKELIIWKPDDPMRYIKDELPKIARLLYAPRLFFVGPNGVGQQMAYTVAQKCGAKFLTLGEIVDSASPNVRSVLASYVEEDDEADDDLRKLLVTTIMARVTQADCQQNGYVLFGFPQNRAQALCAQQTGLLPRQVFILVSDPSLDYTRPPKRISDVTALSASTYLRSESIASKRNKSIAPVSLPEIEPAKMREVSDAFDFEICKMMAFEIWSTTPQEDIEAELLANMISVKPCGSPWIPKVLIFGPPASGKSMIADDISNKYSLVNVDFLGLVRGAAALDDEVGQACTKYLRDLLPINESIVKELLSRRMLRDDCLRKGWILHGFPQTAGHLYVLEALHIVPNRVFFVNCSEEECRVRMETKRNDVLQRRLPGEEDKSLPWIDEMNFAEFPYGRNTFRTRYQLFSEHLKEISRYFGKRMIYVDANQPQVHVIKFVEAALLRPPVVRYPAEVASSSQLK